MPVPVTTCSQQQAPPVYNPRLGFAFASLNKVPLSGQPPAGASPQLQGNMHHGVWDDPKSSPQQDFTKGLAFAANASAIKGISAQAQNPPLEAAHLDMQNAHGQQASWDSYGAPPFGDSPIYDDESPEAPSSPIEPVTPFGLFVDRIVAPQIAAVASASSPEFVAQQAKWDQTQDLQVQDDQSMKDTAVNEVVTPSATPEYRKLAEYFSDWTAKFVWKVCAEGMALPESFGVAGPYNRQHNPEVPPSYLAGSIHSLLLSTLLEPSAILLALWYIARLPVFLAAAPLPLDMERENLFRMELLGDLAGSDRDSMETAAPFRLVVLGFMLSNKWLSDHTYSNKTWHTISNVPIVYLNRLELLAVSIFQHDLSVSNQAWSQWLGFVMHYHANLASSGNIQPISRPSSNPRIVIRKSIEDILAAVSSREFSDGLPQPVFTGLDDRRREQTAREDAAQNVYDIDLDEDGPLKEEYIPRRRASGSNTSYPGSGAAVGGDIPRPLFGGGRPLPPPAKWSPEADELVLRGSQRLNGPHYPVSSTIAPFPSYNPYPPAYEQAREPCANQNWSTGAVGYMAPPVKQVAAPAYGFHCAPQQHHLPAYSQVSFVQSLAMSQHHSRSQSLSYGQENHTISSRNHLRSFSQVQGNTPCYGGIQAAPSTAFWGPPPSQPHQHHAQVLAPIYNNVAYHQSAWLTN